MNKPRLYFDTSVFGGVYDEEFSDVTGLLFEMVNLGLITCVFSDLTETELKKAPQKVRDFFVNLPKEHLEFVEVTDQAYFLANKYLEEKVVGKTSKDDCVHIATATISKVDYLVSWNFKHIVNVFRIKGYNEINLRNNYIILDIRSPKEIVYNES